MTTDWRALCAELLQALTTTNPSAFGLFAELEDRARAALEEADGPAVPEGMEPASVAEEPNAE